MSGTDVASRYEGGSLDPPGECRLECFHLTGARGDVASGWGLTGFERDQRLAVQLAHKSLLPVAPRLGPGRAAVCRRKDVQQAEPPRRRGCLGNLQDHRAVVEVSSSGRVGQQEVSAHKCSNFV